MKSLIRWLLSKIGSKVPSWMITDLWPTRYVHLVPIRVEVPFPVKVDQHLTFLFDCSIDSPIVKRVYWKGSSSWEAGQQRFWATLCSRHVSVVEIGANVGFYAFPGALKCEGSYTAFEPLPYNFDCLSTGKKLNKIENLRCVQKAVVPEEQPSETVTLVIPHQESHYAGATGASILGSAVRRVGTTIDVEYELIVDAIDGADLIKIDAEGLEYELILAARQIIEQTRPTLIIEVLRDQLSLTAYLDRFCKTNNYKMFRFSNSGLVIVDNLSLISQEKFLLELRDFIFIPSEKIGNISDYILRN